MWGAKLREVKRFDKLATTRRPAINLNILNNLVEVCPVWSLLCLKALFVITLYVLNHCPYHMEKQA
jgi:hypothetical protein